MSLVECKDVCVNYGSFEACKNVNFTINEGDYLCIVGANGSGKTTLVKALLNLIPIKSGFIYRDASKTGYLPQQTNIKRDFPSSVKEVVFSGFAASSSIFLSKQNKESAFAAIKKMGLEELVNRPFSDLSGGQRQRVLLARALCAAKSLLVLDEPVTGLDPVVTDELYSIIQKLNREDGLGVIMVSHDVHRAVNCASHILQMNKSPLFFGTSSEYQKTKLYEKISGMEVCSTHTIHSCNATHI